MLRKRCGVCAIPQIRFRQSASDVDSSAAHPPGCSAGDGAEALPSAGQLQRPKSLAEQAADQIRARIIRGEFELGAALSETTLATEMGVSKTPIREAFLRLKTEGLV